MRQNTETFLATYKKAQELIAIHRLKDEPISDDQIHIFVNKMDSCFQEREDSIEIFNYVNERQMTLFEKAGDEGIEENGTEEEMSELAVHMMFFMHTQLDFNDPKLVGVKILAFEEDEE